MSKLTERQESIVGFLASYTADRGYTPSMREVANFLGGVSTNAVEGHYKALETKGYIARTPRIARSLQILKALPTSKMTKRASGGAFWKVESVSDLDARPRR
jgi:SOS-response transcriptional repressor LexA